MATLTKEQQADVFHQGKQWDNRDVTANAFLGNGIIDPQTIKDEKIKKQALMFHQNGFDPRDVTANDFHGLTEDQYSRIPEQVRNQMEKFTGSPDFHPSAKDFLGS